MQTTVITLSPARPRQATRTRYPRFGMLLVALILYGCGSIAPQNLAFSSLSEGDGFAHSHNYQNKQPAIVVVSSPQEALSPDLGLRLSSRLADPLRSLDYTHTFAVLVLQGLKGSGGFHVTVQQVLRRGNRLTVQAKFVEPIPGEGRTLGFTSPYHLIAVAKDPTWEPVTQIELVVNSEVVAVTTHTVI